MVILVVFLVIVLAMGALIAGVVFFAARKGTRMIGQEVAQAGLAQAAQVTSGQTTAVQEHAGQLAQLEGMAGTFGIHLDLADDLGTKVPGTGMQQPTQGTLHVVGRSAPDARSMRAPCTIAYAIQAPGVPAFSGEQVFEVATNQWPEPEDTLPCVFDAADPTHVDIVWSQLPTSGDTALTDAQALAEQLNQQPDSPTSTPPSTG